MRRAPLPNRHETVIHPYVFALQEGKGIQADLLNYSLMLVQTGVGAILPGPTRQRVSSTPVLQLLKR